MVSILTNVSLFPNGVLSVSAWAQDLVKLDHFNEAVLPLLKENCYKCDSHEAGKAKGGLVLDSKPGWSKGGGVKGGFAHGQTDEEGWEAVDGRVHIHDLHATMLHLLGMDHERLTYRFAGRDFRLTDVKGNVVNEIFV